MRRQTAALCLTAALLVPVGGCYRYEARAENRLSQPVEVSIHKGTRGREISNVVVAPGGSVGWSGAVNGPVVARVTRGGETIEVPIPRRDLTVIEIDQVGVRVQGAAMETPPAGEIPPPSAGGAGDAGTAGSAGAGADDAGAGDSGEEMIDLIED